MAELLVLRATDSSITNSISLDYDEDSLEAQKIIWRSSDFTHLCIPVTTLSQDYNLTRDNMNLVDANTFEFILPTGLFLVYDEMGDLDPSGIQSYLRNK